MVAQIIPALIIGAVILISLGKLTLPKTSAQKERDAEVDTKGAGGTLIDDIAGTGASDALKSDLNQKGAAGVLLDGAFGQGAYKDLTTKIDAVEKTRVATIDGFYEFIDSAERGRQAIVQQIQKGVGEFAETAHRSAMDYQPYVGALFGPLGLLAGQVGRRN